MAQAPASRVIEPKVFRLGGLSSRRSALHKLPAGTSTLLRNRRRCFGWRALDEMALGITATIGGERRRGDHRNRRQCKRNPKHTLSLPNGGLKLRPTVLDRKQLPCCHSFCEVSVQNGRFQ